MGRTIPMPASAMHEAFDQIQEGHLVRWNGRTRPQVVTEVSESGFEVKSHQGSYYQFYPHGQYLINQQSGNKWEIDEFEIVGEVYDIDLW